MPKKKHKLPKMSRGAKKYLKSKEKALGRTKKRAEKAQVFRQTRSPWGQIGAALRELNVGYPWLKIALLVLLFILPLSEAGMVREVHDAELREQAVAKLELKAPKKLKVERLKGKKLVALTFDDGPSRETTGRLLDILKEKKVKATFFAVGRMAEAAPELLKRERDEGHVVASHSMTHRNLATATEAEIRWEMDEVDRVFTAALGEKPTLIRPPYGAISDLTRRTVAQPLMLWSVDPVDWRERNAESVRSKAVGAAFDGAVILMHDIYTSTVDAVPRVIDELRAQGYEFVTLPELAEARGVKLESGISYGSFR